jgi:hypothetical protein
VTGLERDLIADCHRSATAMGAYLTHVGQRNARGSGTTVGYPDLTLICAGHTVLIEVKRPKVVNGRAGELTMGQVEFMRRAGEQGVKVHAIRTVAEFEALVNACRRCGA